MLQVLPLELALILQALHLYLDRPLLPLASEEVLGWVCALQLVSHLDQVLNVL